LRLLRLPACLAVLTRCCASFGRPCPARAPLPSHDSRAPGSPAWRPVFGATDLTDWWLVRLSRPARANRRLGHRPARPARSTGAGPDRLTAQVLCGARVRMSVPPRPWRTGRQFPRAAARQYPVAHGPLVQPLRRLSVPRGARAVSISDCGPTQPARTARLTRRGRTRPTDAPGLRAARPSWSASIGPEPLTFVTSGPRGPLGPPWPCRVECRSRAPRCAARLACSGRLGLTDDGVAGPRDARGPAPPSPADWRTRVSYCATCATCRGRPGPTDRRGDWPGRPARSDTADPGRPTFSRTGPRVPLGPRPLFRPTTRAGPRASGGPPCFALSRPTNAHSSGRGSTSRS